MDGKKRVDTIMKLAMSSAGVDSKDLTLGPKYREHIHTYKGKNQKKLDKVRKKLAFINPDETFSEESPAMTSFASIETITVGNTVEMTGPINYDQQQYNYSEALMDEIVGGPSGPNLEFVPADLSEEQSTVPADDYFVVQIDITEKGPDKELTNIELTIPETPTACNAEKQAVKSTKSGLTTLEMYTENNIQGSANSTNYTIVGYSQSGGSKTINPQKNRKRKCKTEKMYIDYLSDEDYSTFIDCEVASISDEWLESSSSCDGENVVSKTAKTKKSNKLKSKKQNTSLDDINEETVREKGLRNKRINLRKDRSQKRITGQEYVRSDGKIIESKSIQPNPCIGKKCGNKCDNIDTEKDRRYLIIFRDSRENVGETG